MSRSALSLFALCGLLGLAKLAVNLGPLPSPPVAPAPARPAPPTPRPAAKPQLYLFAQPGCAPCQRVRAALADPALREELGRFDFREVGPGDPLWKTYKITSTPTLIAVDANGTAHRAQGTRTLGQLAAWLADVADGRAEAAGTAGEIHAGGPVGPGGIEIVTDLPEALRMKNVGGRDGAGLCVPTSINHAANWQNERRLQNLQKQMRQERGGGWPEKVDRMIAKYGPGTPYLQYEGRDPSILELALKTGRMPSVTYNGHDGVFYRMPIAHMVNLVYLDGSEAAILDNNNIDKILWLSRDEFLTRWTGGRNGWSVVLWAPRPPAPPRRH